MGMEPDIPRLSPAMASRKNQVLAFIRLYWRDHGVGPALSEMAAAVGTSRARVQDAIRKLAKEGRVIWEPGVTRGVRPAESHEEALRVLQAQGWTVNPDRLELIHPAPPLIDLDAEGKLVVAGQPVAQSRAVTKTSLPPTRARAHGAGQGGDGRHGDGRDGGRGRGDAGG
jgi:SOS-response transcriptional repressor LexA